MEGRGTCGGLTSVEVMTSAAFGLSCHDAVYNMAKGLAAVIVWSAHVLCIMLRFLGFLYCYM